MKRIGSQRKYECDEADFPICLRITARGMECFQGVLSNAIVVRQNPQEGKETLEMGLEINGLVGTTTLPWSNTTPVAKIRIVFAGYFATTQDGTDPKYEIKLIARSGCEEVTTLRRPTKDPAEAHLIFQM